MMVYHSEIMKREMALNTMIKVVIILTVALIFLQYYFYRVRERKLEESNRRYFAEQALLEARL